ncbi:molecular chaperone [Pseudomonas sp. UFMG81]|uniref:molecular chaperone n=1 Tax=Pseudomonas sp. UFMG81 TaxID=2745936 RepID=UPI00188E4D61|nr:molecular chaperone [Pseudomonas sp. UFMG81]
MKTMKMLCLPLLLIPLTLHAAPELNVGGLHDYLPGERSTLLKRVRNGGDMTAFVKVSVAELVYDADGVAREVAIEDLPLEQRGLVASPARLIIPARGMQGVRLLYRGERDRERYFRLRFIPVLPEHGDGFAIGDEQAKEYRDDLTAGVNVLAGYGTLLFVRPNQSRFATPVRGEQGRLVIANEGNSTVILDHFRHCSPDGRDCVAATKHHLLPGRMREFAQQPGRHYRFDLIEGDKRQEMTFKG